MQYIVLLVSAFWVFGHGGSSVPEAWCDNKPTMSHMYNAGKHHCACSVKHEGALKYADGKLMVCNGKEWSALQYEGVLGREERPGFSCQHILENSKTKLPNGIYYIRMKGEVDSTFPVYCDMDGGGYTMVFKAVGGNNKPIYATYSSDKTSVEDVKEALDLTKRYTKEHYKNRIMLKDNWAKFDPSLVKVALFAGGRELFSLRFDAKFSGRSSDYLNWFSPSKLTNYPWSDLKYQPRNYFSIEGACHPSCRNFFINRNYGGCPNDAGWLVTASKECSWEKEHGPWPAILYSKTKSYINWNRAENVGAADVLVVFVKEEYNRPTGLKGLTRENPGSSCKDILEARQGKAENGIFWIKFSWEADPFQVYCDMESGGYTLAFKMVSGNSQDVLKVYTSTTPANEHLVEAIVPVSNANVFRNHYKNRIALDANWKKFNPSFVKVVLYTGGEEKFAMKFDGKLSDYLNWFTATRLLSSPYTDVKTEPKNFFSVYGEGLRNFFINRNYGGCPNDAGWFVTTGKGCPWETRFPYPTVIYSKVKTYTNWNTYGNVASAEVMAVYVQ